MNPMDEAEKKSVLDMLHKLPDEKVDMFLNYLKYLSTIKEWEYGKTDNVQNGALQLGHSADYPYG